MENLVYILFALLLVSVSVGVYLTRKKDRNPVCKTCGNQLLRQFDNKLWCNSCQMASKPWIPSQQNKW